MSVRLLPALFLAFLTCLPSLQSSSTQDNVGKILPKLGVDFLVNDPGRVFGKPKIVEFWATWCGPCVRNIPHLNKLHSKYASKGLVIIGLTKEEPRTVTSFMEKNRMDYAVGIDDRGSLARHFGVRGIPHALLIDASDKVIWEGHPSDLTDELIRKALASAPPAPRKLPKVL
jgi:thiol-disulfide isomerase/thioredoxin